MSLREHGDTFAVAGMLDFAVNVWPGPRPPGLERALRRALNENRYPDQTGARTELARKHGRSPDDVLLTNGACEAFWLIAHTLRPKTTAVVHPSFTEPEVAARAVGSQIVRIHREPDHWQFDGRDIPDQADLVVVANPNNPTGNIDSAEKLLLLTRPGRLVVVDESFMEFAPGAESLASHPAPGLAIVRSMTKLWSIPGIRAGYLLAQPELVARLNGQRQPWSVNAIACAALTFAATDTETPQRVAHSVALARVRLQEGLHRVKEVRTWPSETNFILLKTINGPALVDSLRAARIAVRPAQTFPGLDENTIRISVRRPHENRRLLEATMAAISSHDRTWPRSA
jgi:histidinol-phosphate/aromatic aminotransferase/cobyric acid decarboxylase-like protein